MKPLKIILLATIFLFAFQISSAQVVVKIYPKKGTVITKIHKPKVVVHKKVNYYYADGVWYNRARGQYVVIGAPQGVKIRRLPRGYKVLKHYGRTYYKYRGVVYKKQRRHFIVVNM